MDAKTKKWLESKRISGRIDLASALQEVRMVYLKNEVLDFTSHALHSHGITEMILDNLSDE